MEKELTLHFSLVRMVCVPSYTDPQQIPGFVNKLFIILEILFYQNLRNQ